MTEVNPDALAIAAKLDAERVKGKASGLLHGVPILVKNNIATLDKMNNTAGSYALIGAHVPRDSTVVTKLRAAGAIILGKANMSQWAAWRGNSNITGVAINGWSAYGGQCQGVYYSGQDPSGSSSGSAVASSLGLTFAALGSETAGSLILPGQASNVVAIKPTVGLTSRSLLIPVSPRQDTIGPLARTVRDAATILQTIAGRDSQDNYTSAQPSQVPDYIKACKLSALSGARIGIPRNVINSQNGSNLTSFNNAIKTLKAAGATIVDNINITDYALSVYTADTSTLNASIRVLDVDFVSAVPSNYLSKLTSNPNDIKSVSDLRNFTQQFPAEDFKNFPSVDTSNWDAGLALGYDNTSPKFWADYQINLEVSGRQGILGLLTNHSLDALIAPTTSAFNLPALAGTPVVQVPMGFDNNDGTLDDLNHTISSGIHIDYSAILRNSTSGNSSSAASSSPPPASTGGKNTYNNPVGISFMGAKWSEEKLIGYAYAFEQRSKVREKNSPRPYIVPKTQLADVVVAGSGSGSGTAAHNASYNGNASALASR